MRLETLVRTLVTALVGTSLAAAQQPPTTRISPHTIPNGAIYAKLPLTFEANQGQANTQVKFLSRGSGYTAYLTTGGMVLSLRPVPVVNDQSTSPERPTSTTLQFRLLGASRNPVAVGEDVQPGTVNYFIGNNPAKWHTSVPTYAKVRYKNVYPGIDLIYYGNHRQLEYDFAVSPGADPHLIQFEIQGASQIAVDSEGNLVLSTGNGELHFQSPVVYQEFKGQRTAVDGNYVLRDSNHVAFQVSQYDPTKPLVIDPVLVCSTYLGGSGNDQATGIAVDTTGSVYVTGYTDSADFPLTPLGSVATGATHVFVAKLDSSGTNLAYADYIGGNSYDFGYALVLDNTNDVYVTGSTSSSDFPTVNPYQASLPGPYSGFLTKISASGSSLSYSSYLGGASWDQPSSIGIDSLGEVYVAGTTQSTNFPTVNAYQATMSANQGGLYGLYGFLTKFSTSGSSLIYSTYLGGNSNVIQSCWNGPCWPVPYNVILGVAVDASGNAYVTGNTNAYNFPVTSGAYLTTDSAPQDGIVSFVSKLSSSGNLDYSTYFYASSGSPTQTTAIAADSTGSAYVTGLAVSDGTFPITSTTICDPSVYGSACGYAFVTKFDPTGSSLLYSTFLGPNNYASPQAIALDASNDAYILASSSTGSFSIVNGIEPYTNGSDILLVEIDPAASSELFATYLGGSATEWPAGIALDSNDSIYVAGSTDSIDFPVTEQAFQNLSGGNTDAFVLKIGPNSAPAFTASPAALHFAAEPVGTTSQAQTILLRNMGSSPLSISSISVSGDFSQTNNCGTSVPAAGSCSFSATFTPTAEGHRTGSILVQDNAAGFPHVVDLGGDGLSAIPALTPLILSFSSTPVRTSSTAQTVTFANNGNAALNISSIQVTGNYAQSNNCPAALAAASSCTISIIFTPAATGALNGTLTISDDASGSPQTVQLTGTGADFSLASNPTSDTVKSGSTATYVLTVSSAGGSFINTVKLNCSGLPTNAACSFSPSSVIPTGNQRTSTLTITTTSTTAELIPVQRSNKQFISALWLHLPGLGLFGMIVKERKRLMGKFRLLTLLAVIGPLVLMSACAGGTGTAPQGGAGTPPGTYTITITGTSSTLQHSLPLTLTIE